MISVDQLKTDLNKALKAKDELVVSTLRMLIAELANQKIALFGSQDKNLTNEQIIAVIKNQVKKRKEAAELYQKGDRPELAEKEQKEAAFLKAFLPEELSGEKIEEVVKSVIQKTNAQTPADFGKVMGMAMSELKGQADGNEVSVIVKKLLT